MQASQTVLRASSGNSRIVEEVRRPGLTVLPTALSKCRDGWFGRDGCIEMRQARDSEIMRLSQPMTSTEDRACRPIIPIPAATPTLAAATRSTCVHAPSCLRVWPQSPTHATGEGDDTPWSGAGGCRRGDAGRPPDSHPSWRPPAMAVLSVVMGRWPTQAHENGSATGSLVVRRRADLTLELVI